jgi:hypothetical protein
VADEDCMAGTTAALCFLLALFAGDAQAPAQINAEKPAIELPLTPWRTGDTLRSTSASHSLLATRILEARNVVESFDQVEDKSSVKTIDVLGADGGGPTRVRVTYHALHFLHGEAHSERDPSGLLPEEAFESSPLEGRTFVLAKTDDGFRVYDECDKPIDPSLAQLVLEEEGAHERELLRAGDMLARTLARRPLPLGVPIDIAPAIARRFVDAREELDHVAFTVTPRGSRAIDGRACAVFDAALAIRDAGADAQTTTVDLAGEIWFDAATGRYAGIELAGRLVLGDTAADAQRVIEVTGEGPWTISERVAWSRKP